MVIFRYDKSFEGLLTCVFEAYERKTFPDLLLDEETPPPLFYDQLTDIATVAEKSARVWKGLEKKLSPAGLSVVTVTWLSELPDIDLLLLRYIRKAFDSPRSVELNFGDPDVLRAGQIWKKVTQERCRLMQFVRFQKTADGTYFAAVEPLYNVLPIAVSHFRNRFADQSWLIYDTKRKYGYFYDLATVREVTFDLPDEHLLSGKLADSMLDDDERLFQQLWKTYFKSICIRERINPRLHRQHLPVRFWKYLTEKQ